MNPEIWGPEAWFFLHSITFNYPGDPTTEEKEGVKKFFESLEYALPCGACKHNYKIHLKNNPLTDDKLTNTETLSRWLVDIHNEVNKIHGKKIYTYDEAYQLLKNRYTKKTSKLPVVLIIISLVILLIVVYLSS